MVRLEQVPEAGHFEQQQLIVPNCVAQLLAGMARRLSQEPGWHAAARETVWHKRQVGVMSCKAARTSWKRSTSRMV